MCSAILSSRDGQKMRSSMRFAKARRSIRDTVCSIVDYNMAYSSRWSSCKESETVHRDRKSGQLYGLIVGCHTANSREPGLFMFDDGTTERVSEHEEHPCRYQIHSFHVDFVEGNSKPSKSFFKWHIVKRGCSRGNVATENEGQFLDVVFQAPDASQERLQEVRGRIDDR